MPSTISIGLVGCGEWGSLILRDLRSLGAEVHVMVRSPQRTPALLAAGASSVVNTIAELTSIALDGIVVATPASTHADVLAELADLDVPVFVEKPVTVDRLSADRLAARCAGRMFVMDKWRYHPGVWALRDLRSAGRLGADVAFHATRVQSGTVHADVSCVWTLLPHDLAIALEIFGQFPTPVSATASVVDGLITEFTSELIFDNGAIMRSHLGIVAPAHTRRLRVIGEDLVATLAGGWEEQVLLTSPSDPDGEPVGVVDAAGELPLLAELRMFVEHLRGGPPPLSSVVEGAENVAIVETLLGMAGVR